MLCLIQNLGHWAWFSKERLSNSARRIRTDTHHHGSRLQDLNHIFVKEHRLIGPIRCGETLSWRLQTRLWACIGTKDEYQNLDSQK